MTDTRGSLTGLRVLELGGVGPADFAGMVLADHGADVLRFERFEVGSPAVPTDTLLERNKRRIWVDLKSPGGRAFALDCMRSADVVLEGFRPGVAERLGLGPEDCARINDRAVYARATGWGQTGPLSRKGGHDLNYIALGGALERMGEEGRPPVPPLNLLGDFAAGGLLAAFGILAALRDRDSSGRGQTVDAAMIDGVALFMTCFYGPGLELGPRGRNIVNATLRPDYRLYETLDHEYMAVAALDPPFYARLVHTLGMGDVVSVGDQEDETTWPATQARFASVFASRSRAEWTAVFGETDAMVVPVLSPAEAIDHEHAQSRKLFADLDGVMQPAPAPRFSRTPGQLRHGPMSPAIRAVDLSGWGVDSSTLTALENDQVVSTVDPRTASDPTTLS